MTCFGYTLLAGGLGYLAKCCQDYSIESRPPYIELGRL